MITDKTLTTEERAIIRGLIGKEIVSFEGSPLGPNDFYGAVRLHCQDITIDVTNFFEEVDVSYERGTGTENAGILRVASASGALDLGDTVSGPDNSEMEVASVVRSVEMVNDTIEMVRDGKTTNSFSFTQALVLHLDNGDLVIDRNVWFEVFVSAFLTADGKRALRDTTKDWENDGSEYTGTVKRDFIAL